MSTATTKERTELKFTVGLAPSALPDLWRDIGRHIARHEYVPGHPITHNNTLYFDSDDCRLLKDGLLNRFDHLRIRARKYEYDTPLSEGAHDYYLELKRRQGEIRRKERLLLERSELEALMAGKACSDSVLARNRGEIEPDACAALYREIQRLVTEHGLKPFTLASYRRVAFESRTERLSIDWDIRYHPANASILRVPSLKDLPESPAGREDTVVMELKYTGELPGWLEGLRRTYPITDRTSFSKCDRGTRALLQGPLRARPDAPALLAMLDTLKHDDEDDD